MNLVLEVTGLEFHGTLLSEEVTCPGSMRGEHRLHLLKGGMSKNWWPLLKKHNTHGDASKLFNNWHVARIRMHAGHTSEQNLEPPSRPLYIRY